MKITLFFTTLWVLFTYEAAYANETTFDFSYHFSDGISAITGSLQGEPDATGLYINNISNIAVSLNDVEFNGPITATAWNPATGAWDDTIPAKISTNAALNNFSLADTDMAVNASALNFFWFINDPNFGQTVFAVNNNYHDVNGNALYQAYDSQANSSWTITAVPLPASLPMLATGLAFSAMTMARRRLPQRPLNVEAQ
jgi:hypothetical protein